MKKKSSLKRNITIQIDAALLKQSRHMAVEADTSLSDWVARLMAEAVSRETGRETAKRRALAVLKNPLKLGGKTFSRDELHER